MVDAATREKRRKMLAATHEAFHNTVLMPYVVCWASNHHNLQFIYAQITISSSEDDSFIQNTQTFTEWCLRGTSAQLPMITNEVNDDVKGALHRIQDFYEWKSCESCFTFLSIR